MSKKNWMAVLVAGALLGAGGTALSQVGGPTPITPGTPPSNAAVPAAPSLPLTISAPTEVQIDAISTNGTDAQLVLLSGDSVLTEDADSGDGVNARIITFLAPGSYAVQVWEWHHNAMTATVSAVALPPIPPAAAIAPGAPPAVVTTPASDHMRGASAEVSLTISAPGNYTIDAVSPGFDAQLMIIRDNAEVGRDSDSGGNNNARWTGPLTPGTYGVRVFDWLNRAAPITVTVAPAP